MIDSITERTHFEELFLIKQSAVEKKKLYQKRINDAHNKIRESVKYKRYLLFYVNFQNYLIKLEMISIQFNNFI